MNTEVKLFSPKDLATAIGVSESSVRRWIDDGDIRVVRTAGGHRRVAANDAVQFIRKLGAVVVRPEVLNLPALPLPGATEVGESASGDAERLFAALRDGNRELARGLVLSWYLAGRRLHELFDGPVRDAIQRVGELWTHDPRGVLVEHRATEICSGIVLDLRELLPAPDESAPLAIGAAPAGDPYQIPTLMAGTVLAEAGLRDMNFGANTPLELLATEAVRSGARLVWVSISFVADAKSLRAAVRSLAAALGHERIDLVIGGQASPGLAPRDASNVHAIGSMAELAAFGRGLLSAPRTGPGRVR